MKYRLLKEAACGNYKNKMTRRTALLITLTKWKTMRVVMQTSFHIAMQSMIGFMNTCAIMTQRIG